jgi:serine/threonine protein phosphatase PrpC
MLKKKPNRAATAPTLHWHGQTDRGRVRVNNEDAFLGLEFDGRDVRLLGKVGEAGTADGDFAFAVSDGMGGARAGEYASRITVDKITTLLPHSFQRPAHQTEALAGHILTKLFREVHRALKYLGDCYEECAGMEATLSLCWFTPGRVYFAHVGDSRIYHLANGSSRIQQITNDDTHVGWLLRQGQINEREARAHPRRNVLQKALGGGNQFVDPQIGSLKYATGDVFLLCTDGLVEGLYDHALVDLLRPATSVAEPGNPAHRLVEASIARDGKDNVTALVVEVG